MKMTTKAASSRRCMQVGIKDEGGAVKVVTIHTQHSWLTVFIPEWQALSLTEQYWLTTLHFMHRKFGGFSLYSVCLSPLVLWHGVLGMDLKCCPQIQVSTAFSGSTWKQSIFQLWGGGYNKHNYFVHLPLYGLLSLISQAFILSWALSWTQTLFVWNDLSVKW